MHAEAGDGLAVMYAVGICAWAGIAMPQWLAAQFLERADQVLGFEVDSWDKAFGKPWPGVHMRSLQKWQRDHIAVHEEVHKRMDQKPKPKKNNEFFEAVARELGLNATLVKEHLYEAKFPSPMLRALQRRKKLKTSAITSRKK